MTDPRAPAERPCYCATTLLAWPAENHRVHNPACPLHGDANPRAPASEGTEPTLLACPFCGREAGVLAGTYDFIRYVYCGRCHTNGPSYVPSLTDSAEVQDAEAVAAWNQRALPVAPAAQPEEQEEPERMDLSMGLAPVVMECDHEPEVLATCVVCGEPIIYGQLHQTDREGRKTHFLCGKDAHHLAEWVG